jgi:hypothetical protein
MKVWHRRPTKTRVAELLDPFYRDIGSNIDRYGWHLKLGWFSTSHTVINNDAFSQKVLPC